MQSLGIDVGGSSVKLALVRDDQTVWQTRSETYSRPGSQHVALTGGLGNRMAHLLPVIRRLVETNLTSLAKKGWTLISGNDDFHAAKGAAKFAARAAAVAR